VTDLFIKLPIHIAARTDLDGNDKIVYASILSRIGDNGKCWPGTRRIATDCGVHRSTAMRSLKRLEEVGLIEVENRRNGLSSRYKISPESGSNLQPVAKCDRSQNATTGGSKMQPVPVATCDHNKKDPLNKTTRGSLVNPEIKIFMDWFCQWYKMKFSIKYIVRGGKDGSLVKDLLRSLTLDEIKAATERMGNDKFWGPKSSIGTLSSQINLFAKNETPTEDNPLAIRNPTPEILNLAYGRNNS